MKVLVLILGLAVGSSAYAVGDAGCGLGSLIISKNSKLLQLFAMTTNVSSYSQIFGITSGTSNCSSKGLVMNDKEIQYFVEANQDDLSREMAQGHGERLTTLAALNGCVSDFAAQAFGAKAQAQYEQILPSAKTSAVEMVNNMNAISIREVCAQGS